MPEITDAYKTIAGPSEGLYKDKGSKFIARAYPAADEHAISELLEALRREFHDARHHCYAYRLGLAEERYRINDDGEPSGTAGRPIYGQILSAGLTDILVVVVRYFGGIKLGAGGLVRAYKTSARAALNNARIEQRVLYDVIHLHYAYPMMNEVMKMVKENNLNVINQKFELDCRLEIQTRKKNTEKIRAGFSKIRGVKIELSKICK